MTVRPNTALITARFDVKALANIVKFYHVQKEHLPTKSNLITKIIYDFEKILLHNHLVTPFDSTQDADRYLRQLGINAIPTQLKTAFIKQLAVESIVSEVSDPIEQQDHSNSNVANAISDALRKQEEG